MSDLGVEDADIRGGGHVGIIAGEAVDAGFQRVWTTGKVVGSGSSIGGLIGFSNAGLSVVMSWSAADVKGASAVGGLIGENFWINSTNSKVRFDDNWVAGNVVANSNGGGFSGFSGDTDYTRNWSSGEVSVGGTGGGGFVGEILGDLGSRANNYANIYWNEDTSGFSNRRGGLSGDNGVVLQTLTSAAFGGAAASAWDFWRQRSFRRR